MAPDGELRLFAVPMCGGLVYAGAKALVLGPSAAAVFSGFLFGSVIAIVLGLPLLLWGDRRCPGSRLRHLLSALLQSLAANLLLGLPLGTLLWSTLAGGLALGLLSSLVLLGIERLPSRTPPLRRSPGSIIAVPLSGGLTLGLAASVFIEHSLGAFCLFFLIGGLLGMLVLLVINSREGVGLSLAEAVIASTFQRPTLLKCRVLKRLGLVNALTCRLMPFASKRKALPVVTHRAGNIAAIPVFAAVARVTTLRDIGFVGQVGRVQRQLRPCICRRQFAKVVA